MGTSVHCSAMKVILLFCVVVGVYSQVPTPCVSPPMWEGREVRLDYSQKYEEKRHLFYDETNFRERTIAEVELGSEREFYDHLYLHQENKNYTINRRTNSCNVSTLNRGFHYRGVHPNARFEFESTVGAIAITGEGATIKVFSANETDDFYTGVVTSPSCVPVTNIHISKQ